MSSAEYSCRLFKPIFAYRQTVWTLIRLLLKEQSDLGPHCLQKWLLKSQADDKADDNSLQLIMWWLIRSLIALYDIDIMLPGIAKAEILLYFV